MSKRPPTPQIEFTEGPLKGKRAYVTWEDGDYMRVTPLDGDPLRSIQIRISNGKFNRVDTETSP